MRVRHSRWFAVLLCLVLVVSFLPATDTPRQAEVLQTPEPVAGPGPVERPLPAEARSNRPEAQRLPAEPPGIRAAGKPRVLSAEEWARVSMSGSAAPVQSPGRPNTQADVSADPVFEDLVLRPGFTLGDTSLVVYFELHNGDRSFESWIVRVFDPATGTEQASTTLSQAELDPPCRTIRTFCKSFGAAQGWVLDPAKEYFVTITAVFADGREVVSKQSDNAKPRTTIVPPPISGGQAAGCNCANALSMTAAGQAVRASGVNTATGAFSRVEKDLSMDSFGIPFTSVRAYSSALVNPGAFGPGWAWSYGMRVTTTNEGATVRAEDGAEAFYRSEGDAFVRPAGVRSNLRRAGEGFELVTPRQMVFAFDAQGRLVSVLNPRRVGVRLAYTDWGVSITDPSGRVVKVSIDAGLIRRIELPDSRKVTYGYDQGRLSAVEDARGNTWRYKYSATGLLTDVISPIRVGSPPRNVVDVHNEYDAGGRVVQQADALGAVTRFEWDAGKQEAKTTDADGVVTFDGYRGNVLVYSQRGDQDTVNHRYDGSLNRNLVVNGKHNQHEATFDPAGNPIDQAAPQPFSFSEVTKYDARNNPIEHKDGRGNVWKDAYNDFNELVQSTDAEGNTIRYEYDARGLLTVQIDQRGKVTRYEYIPVGEKNSGLLKAVTSPEARRTEFGYDSTGRQTAMVDPRGTVPGADAGAFTTKQEFDAADRVTAILQPGKDKPWRTSYDEAGRMSRQTTPIGRETRYTYFDNGLVRSVADPRKENSFTYTAAGRRASARVKMDPSPDLVTTYAYNAKGLLEKTTSPRGNVPGANPADFTTIYFYDGNDNLVRIRRPYPAPPGFVDKDIKTDELDRTTSTVDERNRATTFERDNNGNVTGSTDALGRPIKMGYDRNGQQTTTTDSDNQTTTVKYDQAGNRISRTKPEGGITTWEYDGDGLLIASTEPRGNAPGGVKDRYTNRYRYDRAGNPQETIDPLGHSTIYNYDANNRMVAVSDAKGRTTNYTYDDDDQTRTVHAPDAPYDPRDPEEKSTVYDYHSDGLVKSVRDPKGHSTKLDYDRAGRLTSKTDPLGRRTEVGYDAENNVVSTITLDKDERPSAANRAKRTIVDTYDITGRREKRALGSTGPVYTWGYDAKDRTTFYGDPTGKRDVEYDDEDQITKVTRTDTASGRAEVFGYGYDKRGNVTLRTYPDGTHIESDYDKDSRVTKLTTRDGAAGAQSSVWQFGYDVGGRRTTTTLPAATGLVETRGYDDAGRLTSVSSTRPAAAQAKRPAPADSGPVADDAVAPATDHKPGAPTNVTAQAGAAQASVSWKPPSDDGSAPLTGYTVAATPGGMTVEAAPGATSAVVNGLDPGTAYTFTVTASNKHGAGPASNPSLPATPVTLPQNPVSAFQLDLDPLGNPTRVVTTRGGVSESVAYAYDEVDRVTSACYAATTCTGKAAGRIDYRYDLVGNRTSQTQSGSAGMGTTTYQYDDADQLTKATTRIGGNTTAAIDYEYDLDGNQTKAGADKFEYLLDHSLAKATVAGRTTTFAYDAEGLRLAATTSTSAQTTTQNWSWDVNGTLPQIAQDTVTDANGQVVDKRDFAYGPDDEPLALLDPATGVHSYTHDWLGGVANMVSPNGIPEQGYDYDPYGNPRMGDTLTAPGGAGPFNAGIATGGQSTTTGQGPANPLQYTGAYQDGASGTGNYYLRARNYNPGSGRFTSTDPVPRSGAAISPYAYADNNPLAYTDPTGLMPAPDSGGGGSPATEPTTGEQPPGPSPEEIAKAQQLQNKSILDVVLEAGGQILMEILGINDIINCLKGDIGACVMTVVGALPWGKIFKAKKIAEALWKAGKAIFKFFEELKWAKAILRGAERAAEAAKAAAAAAAKAAAEKAAKIKAAAEAAAKKAAAEAAARAKALAAKAKAATKKGAGKADDSAQSSADDVGKSCPLPRRNSFVGGTGVVLADGSSKPIEQTEPGDTVLATDPVTGQTAARQVTHSIRTDSDSEFVDLTLDDSGTSRDRTITTTEHHQFWSVIQNKWVDAGELRSGELLRTSAGTYVTVGAVHSYEAERVTYDLTVDISHTYYVTAGDTSALVHNCGKDQGIYEFPDQHNPGQTYVGKSINLTNRLQDHLSSGRLASMDDVRITHVCGCEDDVFVAEHLRMQQLRRQGVPLSNKDASPGKSILARRIQPMLPGAEDW